MIRADQAQNSPRLSALGSAGKPSRLGESKRSASSESLIRFLLKRDIDVPASIGPNELYPSDGSWVAAYPRAKAIAEPTAPCLSVIVPAFNERSTVTAALQRVLDEPTRKEVIIVDDGSDDGTAETIEEWISTVAARYRSAVRIVLLRHHRNTGKGRAIKTALAVAQGQFVIVQDADLELQPSCYAELLGPLIDGAAEFVIGCRRRRLAARFRLHAVGVAALSMLVRVLYGYNVQDAACCFKVLSRDNLMKMRLSADGFDFCPEVIAKASRLGLTLRQVKVEYSPRRAGEGKKLRLIKDGLKAIGVLLQYRKWDPGSGNRVGEGAR